METTFYHDTMKMSTTHDAVKKLKSNMSLDFNSGMAKNSKLEKLADVGVLASPDLRLLKLASPELERMITQHNGMITTTPTPTQFIAPKSVSEEQEAYALGFVQALEQLRSREGTTDGMDVSATDVLSMSSSPPNLTTMTTVTSLPGSVLPTTITQVQESLNNTPYTSVNGQYMVDTNSTYQPTPVQHSRVAQLKEEPQTVPCMGNTPPMSPIDMGQQEGMKLERKRERNRVAARKCRTRKLERISRLEDKVDQLKGQNADLTKTATSLRDEVCRLKEKIMQHVNSGCQVMLSPKML